MMKKLMLSIVIVVLVQGAKAQNAETSAIHKVLNTYKSKLEMRDTTGIRSLFSADAKVFEGGKDEGGIANYLNHHLAPELVAFKSFSFSNYKSEVQIMGNYASAIETYNYTIVLAKDGTEIRNSGVATTVLRKINGRWKIIVSHGSYRRLK